jgi:hypothetical protein
MCWKKYMFGLYLKYPQDGVCHRVHPSVRMVGEEWRLAEREQQPPDISHITPEAIDAACAQSEAARRNKWPSIFWARDMSRQAAEQPAELIWWLPAEHVSDDGDDSA